MRIERWAIIRADRLDGIRDELRDAGAFPAFDPCERLGTVLLCRVELARDTLRRLQGLVGATVIPSLTAPAVRLPQTMLDLLAQEGVVLDPGDDVQQALRKLRNARGHQAVYDIDKPF